MDIITGQPKPPSTVRAKYGTAQKMRAAISHKFGRDYSLGAQPWMENPLVPGKWTGNPSISVVVSQYMISLRRRKVRSGDVVTSARAMDEATMKKLYEYNTSFDSQPIGTVTKKRKADHPEYWAGHAIRNMLQLLYTLAMLCLLRFDEALRICWMDVTFEKTSMGILRIRLDLPFRKTHQNGGIAPFYLYPNLDKPWLCPVRAFSAWWIICRNAGIDMNGFVFRKKIGHDRFSDNGTDGMSPDSFMECFRKNMCDIKVDPRPYGTHSFRRGGCQYLAIELRWPFRNICSWAGWAEDFDNPGTLFKYLLSWNDNPSPEREDYFNPGRLAAYPCMACGRTCHCA
ncbi:hypothetical protein GLOTRDRAFT_108720 [Gloeophyllum trabeum ATCC 11539]|uniref:DNA breaking-rejoining enzyme n=1 Tax=Gloeophyllum trabeum (strain ATCC 11539 / FP-39264 / Madison 617) TaxID=670483 RepID=S7PRT9_GLOTA|nr:uncharacterized protein GLOTRDRAFT_108720 [Gloeophyllum trabeum ATCC 11539]EPQ50092.1 hypothetical protein GLOTRDRAFT_108720 [Gloeophyllum trabeum ATCC 11539]